MKVRFSKAVALARRAHRPVVALESSVLCQGLKRPHNRQCLARCEGAVSAVGAVPATVAIVRGQVQAGLSAREAEALMEARGVWKVATRDLPMALARAATGATTVSATVEIAAAAGIRVFATGGIGGVHRDAAKLPDVSQDLMAIARHPVAVVCAGAKSVLDLPATNEWLETLGVPVIGVGTSELPGFYTRETGLRLEHRVDHAREAAQIVRARIQGLGQGGLVFALPPPERSALKRSVIERHLAAALKAAKRGGVTGKAVTPFLLGEIARRTGGDSIAVNLDLLEANARFAGQLAVALGGRL